ncbi:MAG: AGE family epimerase/isomerase [Moraxellaceae bacterium]|nr:AGE family epimerase/isomerase [Moraxellaceae bacterium]
MDFRSRSFLLDHLRSTLGFYDPRCVDPAGGFFQCYLDDGTVFDPHTRSLVASCRFVFNYAMAARRFGEPAYLDRVCHGLRYLREVHRNPATGGYAWRIEHGRVVDATPHCYGLAFVLLAYASALRAGAQEARPWLEECFALMESRFWLPQQGAYISEADERWVPTSYRGQNDNMHACEALIIAFEATGDAHYLARARQIAHRFTVDLCERTDGQVWEHYHADWTPDLAYNRDAPGNQLRPWGYQTGHQTEWAKLLLILDRHGAEPWRLQRARALFDRAVALGWDDDYAGLIYGYDLQGQPCDQGKYFWVQAESLAAAALLGAACAASEDTATWSAAEGYWRWYDRIWAYAWTHFVDHRHGAWYRILHRDNRRHDNRKSYNNKADYHTMGACHEVLNVVAV